MKIYALHDEENERAGALAYLECYEQPQAFFFELPPQADPWELPFVLHEFAQRGQHTIDSTWSRRWVQSRIVPPDRQNLGEILRENGLDAYDELRLLELTGGRCAQDGCHLTPIAHDQLPAWYLDREHARLADAYALEDFRILAVFRDAMVAVCPMQDILAAERSFTRVRADDAIFVRVSMQPGGHGIVWGTDLAVSADELRKVGHPLPLGTIDIGRLAAQATCDTTEAAQLLGCTRQNISDLVRRGKLAPLKAGGRVTLFLRSDVLARRQ